jgi:putative phosphoribosyl transferase
MNLGEVPFDGDVQIPVDGVVLEGRLQLGDGVKGIVVFSHGSGSSRHSPRNRFVADRLVSAGVGTLLVDLLTPEEEGDRSNVFDIGLLTRRLEGVTDWLVELPSTSGCSLGYFGASTGAASALCAAAGSGRIEAVVSRGGRVDLAGSALAQVTAPTLLIVGGIDTVVLELNRLALAELPATAQLVIVEGASHLFEEPGTLEQVADLACAWFKRHLLKTSADH